MTPPLCNDCQHFIKQSPGFCRRAAYRDHLPRSVDSRVERSDLDNRWRITEERIEGLMRPQRRAVLAA